MIDETYGLRLFMRHRLAKANEPRNPRRRQHTALKHTIASRAIESKPAPIFYRP